MLDKNIPWTIFPDCTKRLPPQFVGEDQDDKSAFGMGWSNLDIGAEARRVVASAEYYALKRKSATLEELSERAFEIRRLDSIIQEHDSALTCEISLDPKRYIDLDGYICAFEYSDRLPEEPMSMFVDCAPTQGQRVASTYTVHGIQNLESWLARQIQGYRDPGEERYTPQEIAKMIRLNPHLHPGIKSNLLSNLKTYTDYQGWDTPEHIEEQAMAARGISR